MKTYVLISFLLFNSVFEAIIDSTHRFINEPCLEATDKTETIMKAHVSVLVLLFVSATGVLVSGDSLEPDDRLVSGNSGKLAKRSLILAGAAATAAGIAGAAAERLIIEKEFPKLVSFTLFTKNTTDAGDKLFADDIDSLLKSHYDPAYPTVFIIHGWRSSCQTDSCTLIRDAYLKNGYYNVILFDWSKLAKFEYKWLTDHIPDIARQISRMIDFLVSEGMDPSELTVIGHSLGGHVAGLASYYAKNKANYVVALDPAGPTYATRDEKSRLSQVDGAYVEVIHTTKFFGFSDPIGDVDFYVNNAQAQQNCDQDCTHERSFHYFAESVNSDGFLARSCDSFANYENGNCDSNPIAIMGGVKPAFNVTGKYYLTANLYAPFAKNTV